MELRITNPEENGFLKEIQWNQEEVKSWVAARVQDYKTIAYTADQAKDMKRDRADLNKLKAAFEDERKRLKKNQSDDINKALEDVKKSDGYLFGKNEPINNAVGGTGGNGGADIGGDDVSAIRAAMGLPEKK